MKIAFFTLGCKVNQYETQQMKELAKRNNFDVVSQNEESDVYVVNSCTVTQESTRKSRQALRKFKSQHPGCITVFTGCVPSAFPEEADRLDEADIVISNKNNGDLYEKINEYLNDGKQIHDIQPHSRDEKYYGQTVESFDEHTRCFVKIQDGCDRYCSYCAIPYAKGPSRSKIIDDIQRELTALSNNGYSEVVLIGINLTSYGKEIGLNIADAVECAQKINGIKRIRLGSLEPDHMTDKVIERLKKCDKLMPQFHLSLQSGSDTVLKRMNRHYTTEQYYDLTVLLRNSFKNASITTDIITGFPGENEQEFDETLDFVEKVKFEKVHAFPFSKRDGTPAARMTDQLSNETKSERARKLIDVAEEIRERKFTKNIGQSFEVLFERPKNGFQVGYTENYTPVKLKSDVSLTGQIRKVRAVDIDGDTLICELE